MTRTTSARPRALRALSGGAVALGLGVALALGAPLAASAHVGLLENTAEAGSRPILTFTVPNESATAATTGLRVDLPTDTPFASVRPVAVAGWQAEVVVETLPEPVEIGGTTLTEAPVAVVWTALDGGFGGDELGLFSVRVGPVPDVDAVTLPAQQTYSDGSVVPWEGDDAPVLFVNALPVDHHGGSGDDHGAGQSSGTPDAPASIDVVARAFGLAGLALGVIAIVLTVISLRQAKG